MGVCFKEYKEMMIERENFMIKRCNLIVHIVMIIDVKRRIMMNF
jgi:hypothetical protein